MLPWSMTSVVACRFTSDQNAKEMFAGASGIVITTYSMVAYSGRRSEESMKVPRPLLDLRGRSWCRCCIVFHIFLRGMLLHGIHARLQA